MVYIATDKLVCSASCVVWARGGRGERERTWREKLLELNGDVDSWVGSRADLFLISHLEMLKQATRSELKLYTPRSQTRSANRRQDATRDELGSQTNLNVQTLVAINILLLAKDGVGKLRVESLDRLELGGAGERGLLEGVASCKGEAKTARVRLGVSVEAEGEGGLRRRRETASLASEVQSSMVSTRVWMEGRRGKSFERDLDSSSACCVASIIYQLSLSLSQASPGAGLQQRCSPVLSPSSSSSISPSQSPARSRHSSLSL
jgi:hypothetical protein